MSRWVILGRKRAEEPSISPVSAVDGNRREPVRVPRGEIGSIGTTVLGGQFLREEYLNDLRGTRLFDTVDRMRRSDGQIRAILNVLKLPILRADYEVKPAKDTPHHRELADWVENNLFNMTISWLSYKWHELLMLDYGHSVFEVVWEYREDGRVWLRKLAPRMQRTIFRWHLDDKGGIAGITQRYQRISTRPKEYTTSGPVEEVFIPIDKLLVFTNEREGSNYAGVSILRSAYKHWVMKTIQEKIDAMASERHGVGVPVGTIEQGAPPTIQDRLLNDMITTLMGLHAHEKNFVVEVPFTKFRLEDMRANSLKNIVGSMEYHDRMIARSVVAEFLNMGTGTTGSWAMHRDKTSFFLLGLEAVANNGVDTMQRYLIPKMVRYNFAGVEDEDLPKLHYSRLETRQLQEWANAVARLTDVGLVTPDASTEDAVRFELGLPTTDETRLEV